MENSKENQSKIISSALHATRYTLRVSRGQMLVEAMVSMGILTVAVFAIFSLLTRSTSLNRVMSQQYVATYLAAEGIELVKNITDSSLLSCGTPWNENATEGVWAISYTDTDFSRRDTDQKLKIDPATGFYQYTNGVDSPFSRAVIIKTIRTREPSVEIRATSVVTWKSRGGVESEVRLEDHFFRWRPQPEC